MTDPSELLRHVGRALFTTTRATELGDRMSSPRVGDLVIEISSWGGYDPDGVGWLRGTVGGEPRYPDVWEIEPLHRPGETVTWENATFIALPTDHHPRWLTAEEVTTPPR